MRDGDGDRDRERDRDRDRDRDTDTDTDTGRWITHLNLNGPLRQYEEVASLFAWKHVVVCYR